MERLCRHLLAPGQLCAQTRTFTSPAHRRPLLHTTQFQKRPQPPRLASFSTTTNLQKRRVQAVEDKRIKYIRYALHHPKAPRPLRFSRNRFLRHWTIHRAWQLHRRHQRAAQRQDLEDLYNSMRDACEHLRLMDKDGMLAGTRAGQGGREGEEGVEGKERGRLFRKAMMKEGVWGGVPIEHARAQTEYPAREGWNHEWKRAG